MPESDPLEPLLQPVAAGQRLIDAFDQQGIIIGGIAASLLGQPRLTADADAMLLLPLDDLPQLLDIAQTDRWTSRCLLGAAIRRLAKDARAMARCGKTAQIANAIQTVGILFLTLNLLNLLCS
ncbi:MAG: hypothetical protein Fur0021_35750 [Candidatus Promineifilaceae bacterium]